MSDVPISARIVPWDDRLGVSNRYPDRKRQGRPIEDDDWPIIRRLESEGKLSYSSEGVLHRTHGSTLAMRGVPIGVIASS